MRVRAASAPARRWLRGHGWRGGDWAPHVEPTKEASTPSRATAPVALMARRTTTRSGSTRRRSRAPTTTCRSRAASSSSTSAASRPACCARSRRGTSATATSRRRTTSMSRRCARASSSRPRAASTAVHDKDGWLGALRFWQRLATRAACATRLAVAAARAGRAARASSTCAAGSATSGCGVGYLKAFMDGTLGSQTALDARRLAASRSRAARSSRSSSARGARAGWPVAVHAIGDRANREALDAFEATRERVAAARPAPADRARAVPRARGVPRFAELGIAALGAVHPRAVRPRPRRALLGRPARGDLRLPLAARLRRSCSRTARTRRRGARPARRDPRRRRCARSTSAPAWRPEQALDRRAGTARDHASRRPGSPATSAAAASCARLPGRPGRARPRPVRGRAGGAPRLQVVATMVGGRWVHNPPPWD